MTSFLSQEIIPTHIAPQTIRLHKLTSRTVGVVSKHVVDHDVDVLGVSLRLAQGGAVSAIALATSTDVFFIDMPAGTGRHSAGLNIVPHELQGLFSSPACVLAGFGMARIALHLHRSCNSRVRGVDLSTLYARSTRTPETPAEFVSARIHEDARKHRIHSLWCQAELKDVCLRAWLSAVCAEHTAAAIDSCSKIDTRNLEDTELRCLSELMMNVELLDAEKPTHMVGEFEQVDVGSDGQLLIRNSRFNTRLRPSKQTAIVMETSSGHSITGQAVNAHGKQTGVRVHGTFNGAIERIRVVGREEYTSSEVARDELVLLLLQGVAEPLVDSQFVKLLWFPSREGPSRNDYGRGGSPGPSVLRESFVGLNQSQKEVVKAMWSHDEPLVVAHGPPGTGKTTTIAAALEEWDYRGAPAWVIAQSNVGVKNIARTLIKYSIDFCIIVSKEFYVEWHEHLYESIQGRLIRSDELFSDPVETERRLRGVSTILCTVSMLSNPALDNCAVYKFVPVERLIVDEASQIDSFEFMHLFRKFKTLEKVCMFGDPKQLPPYGKETAPQMKTIFDFKHLKTSAYFLNIQYRMPIPLGEFISDAVYNSKLKSDHKIISGSCVRFVDVRKGSEESAGSSWKNIEETYAVATLIKKYYKHLDFCIITPYDGQRAAIVERLKNDDLPWERVYNVDSFQGHEAPYVIISTVRTTGPGFLRSVNRMNVMLTRCKAGMVVVTNRRFLTGSGRDTLLGGLAQRWARTERDNPWIDVLSLSSQSAALPGSPALAGGHTVGTQAMPPCSWGETGAHPRDAEGRPQASPRIVPGAWPGAVTSAPAGRVVPQATSTRRTNLEQPGVAFTTTRARRRSPSVSQLMALFAPDLPNEAPSSPASRNFDADWSPASLAAVTDRMGQISLGVPSSTTSNPRPRKLEVGDAFPALGEVFNKPPKLAEGRWRWGSDACKL